MRRKCEMPFTMLKIEMDGSVYMCAAGQPANINAFEVEALDIWNSDRFRELRCQLDTEHYDAMCQACPLMQDSASGTAMADTAHLDIADYQYSVRNGVVVDQSGARIPLTTKMFGWLDHVDRRSAEWIFTGWAMDLNSRVPAKAVVVLVDGVTKAAAAPAHPRPDVAKALNIPAAQLCGYRISVATDSVAPHQAIRIFAVGDGGQIGELSYAHF